MPLFTLAINTPITFSFFRRAMPFYAITPLRVIVAIIYYAYAADLLPLFIYATLIELTDY